MVDRFHTLLSNFNFRRYNQGRGSWDAAFDTGLENLFKVGPAFAVFQGPSNGGQRFSNLRP
jgi:hypothetical protein